MLMSAKDRKTGWRKRAIPFFCFVRYVSESRFLFYFFTFTFFGEDHLPTYLTPPTFLIARTFT